MEEPYEAWTKNVTHSRILREKVMSSNYKWPEISSAPTAEAGAQQ